MAGRAAGGGRGLTEPSRFEVWIVELEPVLGVKIGKARPAVVISPDDANRVLKTVIAAPLTSVRRKWPTRVPVRVNKVAGDIALDQMRAVGKQRLTKRVGALSAAERQSLLERLAEMFAP
ncbi:MAG TPA: type II toxin-antitoxin system PemK/MazF family toxin [Vitreimonas sp.]|uniref:type II toxin-antitoxin system PemK/MazF family toxin n=1 Tax=Vitreimonas sp. TaxID=3069702 RepID=UPI002D582F6B|nr:type II toxin-antitoxin system PemK/MazF family toxin [Vitreimonas sp.]HYD89648.1 type II toxin-antitoxin system PemK/MazF family toxin [Vitreimonas sp.]